MADLHPEVEKLIEAGPRKVGKEYYGTPVYESIEEFARRIAALAVEREREECAKVCEEVRGPYVRNRYIDRAAFEDACDACAEDIRHRGKP